MKITALRSDTIYREIAAAPQTQREEIFREGLLAPFAFKWQCVGAPLKAQTPGGYDALSFAVMGGALSPASIDESHLPDIESIGDNGFWDACETAIRRVLEGFEENGISLPTQDYLFTILLSDPASPMTPMTGDYCGDGGIPGYITGSIIPNERSLALLPVALAHEANHNVRWQFMQWSPSVSLGDLIVSEGLAECCAVALYGEDKAGKWVLDTDMDTLNRVIKPVIGAHLDETDFNTLSAYLYGDDIMAMRGVAPVGMPYCAGYACGYHLVRHYLAVTGKTIFEATLVPTNEILAAAADFWK